MASVGRFLDPQPCPSPHSGLLGSRHNSWVWRLRIFIVSFCLKFGAGTMVSLLMGVTPVVMKGPRHFVSFFVSMLLIQVLWNTLVALSTLPHTPSATEARNCRLFSSGVPW